jgi:hypothetical protein
MRAARPAGIFPGSVPQELPAGGARLAGVRVFSSQFPRKEWAYGYERAGGGFREIGEHDG